MSWYRRPLAAGQTFRCASCGRIKRVKYVPTSKLCRRCAAKRRRNVPNVPVSLTENIVVTTVVEKRLRKKAEKDIPHIRAEIVARNIEQGFWVLLVLSAYAILPSFGWWALGLYVGVPIVVHLVIVGILANPRRERREQVELRIRELAQYGLVFNLALIWPVADEVPFL